MKMILCLYNIVFFQKVLEAIENYFDFLYYLRNFIP